MRDAFGGEFMLRLMLVFIVIYVSFTAVSLNYAKAFRVKNKVISYVEENDIEDLSKINYDELGNIILNKQYTKPCKNGNGPTDDGNNKICCNGVVIEKVKETATTYNYKIKTYADWNIGTLNMILTFGGRKQNSEPAVNGMFEITGDAYVRKKN